MSEGQPIISSPNLHQFEVPPLGTPTVTFSNTTEQPDALVDETAMDKTGGTAAPAIHTSDDADSKENIEPPQQVVQPTGVETVDPVSDEPVNTSAQVVETALLPAAQDQQQAEPPPDEEVGIIINNVVCSFSVRCHLNLKKIAMEGVNVIYKRQNGVSLLLPVHGRLRCHRQYCNLGLKGLQNLLSK